MRSAPPTSTCRPRPSACCSPCESRRLPPMADNREAFMRRAIALACESVAAGGGPFGAVIARDGQIIAEGSNRVTLSNDPTAHAEVVVVRAACAALGTFDLRGCEIYASCEPCPMCLGAIHWALSLIHISEPT